MSIASRIEAIEQHLTDDYNVLEIAGADLTNVNKNILNLKSTWQERLLYFMNNGTDVVWNNWDKVTGEGTTLTLNNTLEGKMKINLKGNTSQDSTTGKNLYNDNFDDYTQPVNYRICPITLTQGQTYVLKGNKIGTTITGAVVAVVPYGEQYTDFSSQLKMAVDSQGYGHTLTFTPDSTWTSPKLAIYASDKTTFDNLFTNYEIQLEKGSAATSYEPYTNGASPNPDFPQQIHVVSGDNTIKVCGKNLFYFESQRNTGWYSDVPNMIKEIGAYTLSINDTSLSGVWAAWFADNNGDRIGNFIKPSSSVSTPSTFNVTQEQANAPYIRILPNASGLHDIQNYKIQIEKGSTATTYEAYKGASYPINLGVENLFDFSNTTISSLGNVGTTTVQDDKVIFTANGNVYGIQFDIKNLVEKNTTYTISNLMSSTQTLTGIATGWRYYDGSSYTTLGGYQTQFTFTTGTGTTHTLYYYIGAPLQYNGTLTLSNIQLEKGSKANSYTPYGTTPIELCKIGTYQDKFIRNSGKNKLSVMKNNLGITGSTGAILQMDNRYCEYGEIEEGKQYTISRANVGNSTYYYYGFYSEEPIANLSPTNDVYENMGSVLQYTTQVAPTGAKYLAIFYGAGLSPQGMANEGTTALPYEPYGNGDWYLEKNTGKMILNGTENWSIQTTWSAAGDKTNAFYITRPTELNPGQACYCDYLKYASNVAAFLSTDEYGVTYSASLILRMPKTLTDGNALKTYLASNNMKLYYALLKPTYAKIEGTLESQLNALAKSYASQTNISQESNDLASLLNATALREMA